MDAMGQHETEELYDLRFSPGDLVTTYAPDEDPPRATGGMLLYKDYSAPGGEFHKNDPPFRVEWRSVGIVLSVGVYEAWDGTSRVLVMIKNRVGWNTARCFRHVRDAQ
jgi:hypothetical protein